MPGRARRIIGRLGVAVLAALALVLAGPVGLASAATPTSLTVTQTSTGTARSGQPVQFAVKDQDGQDVTSQAKLSISPDGSCTPGSCTPAKPGRHTVTTAIGDVRSSPLTLTVPDQLPVGNDDPNYTTAADTTLNVPAPGVLGNDTDADGDTLTAVLVTQPGNGALTLNSDGSFTYHPNDGFTGADVFRYRASDGRMNGFSANTDVTITVGDAPPTGTLTITPATATVSVGQGQTYTTKQGDTDVTASTTFTIEPNGSCTQNTCTPAAPGQHRVRAVKGLTSATAILEVPNRLPTAVDDGPYSVEGNTVLTVPAPGVLANDSDADPGTTLTAFVPTGNGPAHGTLVLSPNGGFVYTPATGYVGPDQFSYRARDGQAGGGDDATVTLTVTQPNRAPVAVPDTYSTAFRTPLTVPAPGVLGNDTDADRNPLTVRAVTQPAHGTLALNANGGFTYTPEPGFSGPDAFTYVANDGRVDSAPATVTITVAGPTGPVRADLSVRLTVAPTGITVVTGNDGPYAANQIQTAVKLPTGLRITSAPGGIVGPDGRSVVYRTPTLGASRSVIATITYVVTGPIGGPVQAAVVSPTFDPVIANNAAVAPVPVR